ncbi:MAG: hypothetical protein ACLKAK_07915 [Alkaliphilus sp.]
MQKKIIAQDIELLMFAVITKKDFMLLCSELNKSMPDVFDEFSEETKELIHSNFMHIKLIIKDLIESIEENS